MGTHPPTSSLLSIDGAQVVAADAAQRPAWAPSTIYTQHSIFRSPDRKTHIMYSVRFGKPPGRAQSTISNTGLVIKRGSMKGTFTLYYNISTLHLPSNIASPLDGAQAGPIKPLGTPSRNFYT